MGLHRRIALLLLGWMVLSPAASAGIPLGEWQYSAGQALIPYFTDELPKWQRTVTAGPIGLPRYEGSSAYKLMPGLEAEVRYKNLWFASTAEGLGVNVFSGKNYRVGTSLNLDLGRDADDDDRLRGMGDIAPAPVAKVFAEYVIFPLVLRADASRVLGTNGGWSGDVSAYLPVAGNRKYFIFIGPSVTFSDDHAMQRDFGVTPQQAAASRFSAYRPGGGIRSANLVSAARISFSTIGSSTAPAAPSACWARQQTAR